MTDKIKTTETTTSPAGQDTPPAAVEQEPVTQTTEEIDLDEDDESALFESLNEDDETEETPTEVTPTKKEETPKEPVETEAPKEPVKTETPEPQPQVPQEQQTAAPGVEQQEEDTQSLNARYQEFFDKGVEALSTQVYALDETTSEMLDTQPSKVLPQMAARLHMQVLTAAVSQVAQMLPQLMSMQQTRQSEAEAIETKFYGDYPQLKDHQEIVNRIASAYKQMNPTATADVAMRDIAAMAAVQARVVLGETPPTEPAPAVAAAAPVVPTSAKTSVNPPAEKISEWVFDEE